ncbi:MAG: CaiB/BaiF CoA-transferase family protein [Pseudomonadota bacterium]
MGKPFKDIFIVDFSNVVSGPMAVQMLADQGADVIKVETPGVGDICRNLGARRGGVSSMFAVLNRNKRSIVLDLKQAEAREVALKLTERADVMIENFRPGAMARVGLDYESVKQRNPNLVYTSVSGFGQDGPYSSRRVYDPIIQSISGIADAQKITGTKEVDLVKNLICDKVTSVTTAQAISAALYEREKTGAGQHVEVSMLSAGLAFFWPDGMWNQTLLGDGIQPMPLLSEIYRINKTADGFVTIITVSDDEWQGLCRAINHPEMGTAEEYANLPARLKNIARIIEFLDGEIKKWPTDELCERLEAEQVPFAKVNAAPEVADDPQITHSELIVKGEHPHGGALQYPVQAARFSGERGTTRYEAPMLGEHSEQILAELGFSPENISDYRKRGIIEQFQQ